MATVERATAPPVVLRGVSWPTYLALRDAPENYHIRMTYDQGTLEMMSPSRRHEKFAVLIDRMIQVWSEELNIDIESCRTMTCRREDLEKGLEPDNCYYIQHAAAMRAKEDLDFSVDPPPELAVEIEVTRRALDKLRLYAALGVPEVWRYDGRELRVYRLGPEGRYEPSSTSVALPGFPVGEVQRILPQSAAVGEIELAKSFRDWVRANVKRP
jgi:Uma2 family endonuclease